MAQRSAQQPPPITAYPGPSPAKWTALGRDQARTMFGEVMGLVALTSAAWPSAPTSAAT
jgi:hypothetical protein